MEKIEEFKVFIEESKDGENKPIFYPKRVEVKINEIIDCLNLIIEKLEK